MQTVKKTNLKDLVANRKWLVFGEHPTICLCLVCKYCVGFLAGVLVWGDLDSEADKR